MSINQRVQEIIDKLFSGNKRAFSVAVGIAATVTENIVGTRGTNPSFEVTCKIASAIENINTEWLLTGKGSMFKTGILQGNDILNTVSENESSYGLISDYSARPFIESASLVKDNFSRAISSNNCKTIIIPFIDGCDFLLRNHGDSMVNLSDLKKSINDQDIVACRFWENLSHIRWGEVYAMATKQGYIIKKVVPSDVKGKITCISFNGKKGYTPYDLSLSEISDWTIVVGVASVNVW
jgi:hypothetical protein